jgi:hypothetical protein
MRGPSLAPAGRTFFSISQKSGPPIPFYLKLPDPCFKFERHCSM